MQSEQKNRQSFGYILFFVWPFGLFVKSLFDYRNPNSKNFIWLFAIFLGLTIVLTNTGLDAYRYAEEFRFIAHKNIGFHDIFGSAYVDSDSLDIFKPLMIFLVSRFTDNPYIYFAFIGIVYGYLFSRNLSYVISKIEGNITKFHHLVIFSFLFIIPIQDLQFVRFSTAAHLFFFGAMPFLLEKKKKYLFWACASIFIHFSFIIPVVILIGYIFLPKNIHLYFVLFILSSFFIQLKLETLNSILIPYAPEILQKKVTSYGNEDYSTKTIDAMNATNWYIKYHGKAFDYTIIAFIVIIFIKGKNYLKRNPALFQLFCFALLLTSVSNFVSVFPSGFRFVILSRLFTTSLVILMINFIRKDPRFILIRNLSLPLLIFIIIVGLRFMVEVLGLISFIGNPFFALVFHDNETLINTIKSFY